RLKSERSPVRSRSRPPQPPRRGFFRIQTCHSAVKNVTSRQGRRDILHQGRVVVTSSGPEGDPSHNDIGRSRNTTDSNQHTSAEHVGAPTNLGKSSPCEQ